VKSQILILPGLSSSGPEHWQTHWEQENPDYIRVEQADWFDPDPKNWVATIERFVRQCDTPPILVAHSLATIAIVHWTQHTSCKVRGAFLVAPADVESPSPHTELLTAFIPIPRKELPFPSIIVASTNDPYCSLERVTQLARSWGSQMVIAGALGHINTQSNLGTWLQGKHIFHDWMATLPA
jgi:predicted alpha/beta hydrolase family esterase